MHAGRQAGRQASRTHTERISNAYRTHPVRKMRVPVSTCSAVQYRTTYPHAGRPSGGRQEGRHPERISNESQTNLERITNESRPTMRAPVCTCSAVQYRTTYPWALVRQMYEYSWYEVPYWYEYLLPACMHAGRRAGRQASRTNPKRNPNEFCTNSKRIPSENEGSRIYM